MASGTHLDAAPINVSSDLIVPEYPRREDVDDPVLLVSSNDSLDGGTKWDDLFGGIRHGGTALSRDALQTKAHRSLVGITSPLHSLTLRDLPEGFECYRRDYTN
ncbi:MAG: hypothetical protein WBV46_19460 [Terriglobales bacterium]